MTPFPGCKPGTTGRLSGPDFSQRWRYSWTHLCAPVQQSNSLRRAGLFPFPCERWEVSCRRCDAVKPSAESCWVWFLLRDQKSRLYTAVSRWGERSDFYLHSCTKHRFEAPCLHHPIVRRDIFLLCCLHDLIVLFGGALEMWQHRGWCRPSFLTLLTYNFHYMIQKYHKMITEFDCTGL